MHGVNRELRTGTMANIATLAQGGVGVFLEVGGGGFGDVATAASRCGGLDRSVPALRIDHWIQADGQSLLAVVDVAQGAVFQIPSAAFRAHGRVKHTGEVRRAAAMAHDDKGLAAAGHNIHAIVNAVNHDGHVDGLGRLAGGTLREIRVGGVVAHHAIFGVVAPRAMQLELHVALVAIGSGDDRAAGRDGGAVNGEVDHRIGGAAFDGLGLVGVGQNIFQALGFGADGISTGGSGRNRVNEGIGAVTVGVAGAGGAVFVDVTGGGGGVTSETGVAVIGSGAGHGKAKILKRRHGERFTGLILNGEGYHGILTSRGVSHSSNSDHDATDQRIGIGRVGSGGIGGNHVSSQDRGVE